jgi:hypothetical protein
MPLAKVSLRFLPSVQDHLGKILELASVASMLGPVLHSFAKNSLTDYKFILKV